MKTFGFATKAIIFNKNNDILLIQKSDKEDMNPNTVDIPGGRLEFGEKPEEALIREVKEEVGIEVVVGAVTRVWTLVKEEEEFQLVGASYICKVVGDEAPKLSFEHINYKWLTPKTVLSGDYPGWLKKEVEAALSLAG